MKRSSSCDSLADEKPHIDRTIAAGESAFTPPSSVSPPPGKKPRGSPKKAKSASASASTSPKSKRPAPATSASVNLGARAKLAALVVEAGVKALDRAHAEQLTGLKPSQQKDMLRADGKGALYNALIKVTEGM